LGSKNIGSDRDLEGRAFEDTSFEEDALEGNALDDEVFADNEFDGSDWWAAGCGPLARAASTAVAK